MRHSYRKKQRNEDLDRELTHRTYFQLIHDKQNEDKVKNTYELHQQKVPKVFDNVD